MHILRMRGTLCHLLASPVRARRPVPSPASPISISTVSLPLAPARPPHTPDDLPSTMDRLRDRRIYRIRQLQSMMMMC